MAQYFTDEEFRGSQIVATDIYTQSGYERRLFEATKAYEGTNPTRRSRTGTSRSPATPPRSSPRSRPMWRTSSSRLAAEFATGIRDIESDEDWDEFQQNLTDLGADRYVEIYQQAWDETK